jgi:hypothetical protein
LHTREEFSAVSEELVGEAERELLKAGGEFVRAEK